MLAPVEAVNVIGETFLMLRELARALEGGAKKLGKDGAVALVAVIGGLGLVSCKTTGVGFEYERAVARFVLESENRGSIVTMPVSEVRIQVDPTAVLTEFDLESVAVAEVELGQCLQFRLTHQASRTFYQASANNQGRRMVLIVNGQPLGLQRIERPVSDGIFYVFVEIPDADLPELARNLRGTSIEIQNKLRG